ncbi:hypothetical protein C8R44DRAFT_769238 [Mycena epipterygia]|nr:hypothetical protein C8R44DRAFT_769238 [Mycena epipterygia]
MAAFEFAAHDAEERLRLWNMEQKPEVALLFKDMMRDRNAELGQRARDIIRQRPSDLHKIAELCMAAEREEVELQQYLHEHVDVQAGRLVETRTRVVLSHPNEVGPSQEVRERIQSMSDPAAQRYCSPVLVETLFWEGTDYMPNAHRKKMELDFPTRVDALLDFHSIAFHADINVLKQLYDEDVLHNKEKRNEILQMHRSKMEALMTTLAKDMTQVWAEEEERLRSAQRLSANLSGWTANDWIIGDAPPTNRGVGGSRKRAHMTDSPTILGAAERKPKTAPAPPLRSILKNTSSSAPRVRATGSVSFNRHSDTEPDSPALDEGFDEGGIPGFFLGEMMGAGDMEEELEASATYRGPEIVLASRSPRYTSASQSQQPMYEIFRPSVDNEDLPDTTPRAFNNVARLTQTFEEGMERGKPKAKAKY